MEAVPPADEVPEPVPEPAPDPAPEFTPPQRRDPGAPAPDYGPWPDKFSVELHHGGFFCGLGSNRKYLEEKVVFFDECHAETWCQDAVDQYMLALILGYPDGKIGDVYWLMPGKTLADGLKLQIWEKNAREIAAASVFCKNIVLYVDHVRLLASQQIRDDVATAGNPLPAVMSPNSPIKVRNTRNMKEEVAAADNDGSDSDIVDSDFDLQDSENEGDDSDFDKAVDNDVEDELIRKKVEDEECSDGVEEDFDLQLPHNEDEFKINFKTRNFNPETEMMNPIFKLRLLFSSMKEVRQAVKEYAIKERVQIKKTRNNATRLEAICEGVCPDGDICPWNLVVSYDNRTEKIAVKEYEGKHNCERVQNVKQCSYTYLARRFVEEFRDNENLSMKSFGKTIQKELKMLPSRFKLSKAKYKALEQIHGDEREQFNLLWDYGEELRYTNPGTSFYLRTLGNPAVFSTCYMALYGCKAGFLKGCRPLICLDGTHVKTKYGGQLLTAIGLDGNDQIYPIAIAYVEVECYSSWFWFLTTLKQDLNIINTSPFTIMSDKQKGLIKAVMQIFPHSEHRFCVRHLWQNLRQHHKGDKVKNHLWACARSTTVARWEANMEKLKVDCPGAYAWLEQIPPNTWVKAFFSEFPNCDLLINNTCEVFNKMILEAREVCVLSMLERVKAVIENRMHTKQKKAQEKWKGRICPKIMKKVRDFTDLSNTCEVTPAEMGVFSVMSKQVKYVVELTMRSCTCRRWQLTGIPCHHVIACLKHERIKPEDRVSSCYSIDTYMQAYEKGIRPCRDRSEWIKTNGPNVLPPYYEKKVGRPKRCRRKDPEENEKGTKISKHGVKMHCSYCRSGEHTKRNCGSYKYDLENGIAFAPQQQMPAEQQVPAAEEQVPLAQEQVPAEQHVPTTEEPVPAAEQQVPPDQQAAAEQQVPPEQQAAPGKRNRKLSRKKLEQLEAEKEYEARKKRAVVFDENGDIDDPSIMAHVIHRHVVPSNDPTQVQSTLVYKLAHELPTRRTIVREEMPQESSYVVQHREAIPQTGRTSAALDTWRTTRLATEGAAATRGRGRGRGRTRGTGRTTATGTVPPATATRGRGGGRKKKGSKMAASWR